MEQTLLPTVKKTSEKNWTVVEEKSIRITETKLNKQVQFLRLSLMQQLLFGIT